MEKRLDFDDESAYYVNEQGNKLEELEEEFKR